MNHLIRSFNKKPIKKWLKIALYATIIFGVGIFASPANASETLWENTDGVAYPNGNRWEINLGSPNSSFEAENLLLLVSNLETNIDDCVFIKITVSEYHDSYYNNFSRSMHHVTGFYDPVLDVPTEADGLLMGNKTKDGFWKIDLNTNTDFSSSKYYRIKGTYFTDSNKGVCLGTSTLGTGNTPYTTTKTGDEVVWQIGNDLTAGTCLVDFIRPQDEQTLEDFGSWNFWGSSPVLDPEETPRYFSEVAYSREGSEEVYHDGFYSNGGSDVNYFIFKSQILTEGNWEATAKIFYDDFEDPPILLASETINFTIGIPDESGLPLPEGIDCNSGDFIANGFCHIITYLFIPSSESLNLYQNLFDPIKNKAPFGYFTLLKNEIAGLGESTPAFDLGVSGISLFGTIRDGLIWIIWLWVGVGTFKRLAHLEI